MRKDGGRGTDEAVNDPLLESLDEGFCVIEKVSDQPLDFRYREINPAFSALTGAASVVGRTIREAFPLEPEAWYQLYDEVARTGRPIRSERTLVTTGQLLEILAFRVDDASAGRVGVIFRDLTRRREAERSRAHLSAIVASSQDAIVSKDLDGVIRSWNAGAERLFGFTADEAVGQSVTILIPPHLLHEEPILLARIRRGENVEHFDTMRRHKDGTLVPVSLSVSPILDSRGRVVGASKIARDITERRKAEQQLVDADRRKTEFLAMLAHELRNPLAPIKASLEVLRRTMQPATEADGAHTAETTDMVLGILERQVGHMVRLIDDLMDVGRLNHGKIGLRRARVELAPAIQQAVEAFRPMASLRGQQLTVRVPDVPIHVDADPTRLAQIVGNLLNNAGKFTDHGGHIWLSVERTGPDTPDVSIEVRDSGIGIAADELSRIFDMFSQVGVALDRTSTGLGIGLTLVKTLAELHGGHVEARSDGVGHGSTFVVTLPIALDPAAAAVPPDPEARTTVPPQCVLVVDDNTDSAEMLALLLGLAGHETHTAHDGLAAVETAARLQPDVIVLDIGLPGIDGYEAARAIRARQSDKPPILIALTGWGQDEDRRRTEEAGFDAHAVKPLDEARFHRLLADLTAARASRPSGQRVF